MQLDNFVEMDQQGKGTFDTRKFHKNSPRLGKFLKTHTSYNHEISWLFLTFYARKDVKKNFGVGRPEVPENEKVMLRDAGEVQSDPPYQIHRV